MCGGGGLQPGGNCGPDSNTTVGELTVIAQAHRNPGQIFPVWFNFTNLQLAQADAQFPIELGDLTVTASKKGCESNVATVALDLAGKLNALPLTNVALAFGMSSLISGGSMHFQNNAIQFWNVPGMGINAFTLGNATIYGIEIPGNTTSCASYTGPVNLARHEEAHTHQAQVLGLWFPVAWVIEGEQSNTNGLEIGADAYARGASCSGF
jgi:hypothetical protein